MHKVKCTNCDWIGGQSKLKKSTSQGVLLNEYCPKCGSTWIEDVAPTKAKKI